MPCAPRLCSWGSPTTLPCLLGLITVVPAMTWVSGKAIESGTRKWIESVSPRPAGSDLWAAAAAGDAGEVARHLGAGADVNGIQAEFGITPLTMAALKGHTDIAVQILVRDWGLPALVKCPAITLAVTGFLLLVYETLVRYTWLGALLNGRRSRKTAPSPPGPTPGP